MSLIFGIAGISNAQKLKLVSGSGKEFKNVSELNLKFEYDGMEVGKYKKEQDYIDQKVKDYNKDEPGSGDRWAEAWVNDRSERFEPRFETEMNNQFVKRGVNIKSGIDTDSEYTLIFKTTFTEPGFNVGVMRKDALINGVALLVETANPDKVLAKISIDKSPGRGAGGYDFDTGYRLQEAYAKAGKEIAYFIWKNYLK